MSALSADPEPCPRRLVHLAEDHRGLVDDSAFLHFQPEVVALAGPLADPREYREPSVLGGDVADKLRDQDRLADARSSEETDLPAFGVRADEIDHFQTGLEHLHGRHLLLKRGRRPVNRKPLLDIHRSAIVDRLAEQIENPPQSLLAHGNRDRAAGVDGVHSAHEAVRGLHRHASYDVVAEHLRDLDGQRLPLHIRYMYGVQNLRQLIRRKPKSTTGPIT